MPHDITCQDCGAQRLSATYSTTRYCHSCRLLRNLIFVRDRVYDCQVCGKPFAPVSRGDGYCAKHDFGSNVFGTCAFCDEENVEFIRPNIPLCLKCAKTPGATRHRIVAGLKNGQRDRKAANQHA